MKYIDLTSEMADEARKRADTVKTPVEEWVYDLHRLRELLAWGNKIFSTDKEWESLEKLTNYLIRNGNVRFDAVHTYDEILDRLAEEG